MRVSPFWRSGLTFTILLLAVLPAVDFYTSREFRRQAFAAASMNWKRWPALRRRARCSRTIPLLSQTGSPRWPQAARA